MAQFKYSIWNGPSKYALSVALFHGHSNEQIPVTFDVGSSETRVRVRITSLEREDGSGEKWIFRGYLFIRPDREVLVSGYFSIHDRRGFIESEKDILK